MLMLERSTWNIYIHIYISNVLVNIVKFALQTLGLDLYVARCQNLIQITQVIDGFHYLDVKSTPTEVDGQPRPIDDFQPRKQTADQIKGNKLESEEQLDTFSKKYIVEKTKLGKYDEHLTYLEIKRKKEKRPENNYQSKSNRKSSQCE